MRTLLAASFAALCAFAQPGQAQTSYSFKHPSWMWEEGNVGVWHKARKAEFEAKFPNIRVEATLIPNSSFEQVVTTQIAAGDTPDLLPVFTNMLPPLIDAGVLAPLDDCIAASPWKERLLASVKFAQKDGKTYGVPLTMSPQSLLYNKKLLDAAGAKVPATIEELYAAAKTVKEKTGEWGYAFNNNTSNALQTYINSMQWVLGMGVDWSNAQRQITANDPKAIEAISWVKRFLDEGLSPRGLDVAAVRTMFAQGKVAFLFDGPWVITQVKGSNPDLYPSIGYAVMPTPTHAAITGGAFYTVPAKSPHKADACKYLDIINAEPAQRSWLQDLVQIPGTAVEPTEAFLKENPWMKTMVEVAAKYPGGLGYAPVGYAVNASEFRQIVVDHLAEIYSGKKDVKPALNELQEKLTAWAKRL